MYLRGRVLSGHRETFQTKKGETLAKTKLKVVDLGDETQGDLPFYFVDFIGDAALSEAEFEQVMRHEFTVEIRRMTATVGKNGRAYLNVTGGAVLDDQDRPVQVALRNKAKQAA